jgi:hypothetical protein
VRLEAAGRPTVVVATERFAALARRAARGFGLDAARVAVVPHPIGGEPDAALRTMADRAVEEVLALLTGGSRERATGEDRTGEDRDG